MDGSLRKFFLYQYQLTADNVIRMVYCSECRNSDDRTSMEGYCPTEFHPELMDKFKSVLQYPLGEEHPTHL